MNFSLGENTSKFLCEWLKRNRSYLKGFESASFKNEFGAPPAPRALMRSEGEEYSKTGSNGGKKHFNQICLALESHAFNVEKEEYYWVVWNFY